MRFSGIFSEQGEKFTTVNYVGSTSVNSQSEAVCFARLAACTLRSTDQIFLSVDQLLLSVLSHAGEGPRFCLCPWVSGMRCGGCSSSHVQRGPTHLLHKIPTGRDADRPHRVSWNVQPFGLPPGVRLARP